jgi:hypothetical protein
LPDSIKTDFFDADINAEPSTNSTFRGITIDSSFEYENAFDSIRFNDDCDSNEIDERDPQQKKHDDPRISTEHGIKIDSSFENENASDSIRFNDDGDSNEIDESDLQKEKQNDPRISTEHGIEIDLSRKPENAFDSIRFNDDRDSNEIDKSESEKETTDDKIISTEEGIQTRVSAKSRLCSTGPIRIPLTTRTRRMQLFAFGSNNMKHPRPHTIRYGRIGYVSEM